MNEIEKEENKPNIVCLSQDPDTIFSYGLQVKELITGTKKDYIWNVISQQYTYGKPFPRDGYIKWASEGEENRCSSTLRNVINVTDPICVFSMGDIHHHAQTQIGKYVQVPWVSWFPWDNHDPEAMIRNQHLILQPDVKITMSKFAYNFLTAYGIEVDGMIYNIVDTNVFKPVGEKFREELNNLNEKIIGKKILLFVGRQNWRKNLEMLLAAFYRIRQVRDDVLLYLHVDFNDTSEGGANLDKLIHGLSLEDYIIKTEKHQWANGVSREYLNNIYNICDLYVSPHGGEGFGLPIVEAMACEKPFVVSDCTTSREFAGENNERGLCAKIKKQELEKGVFRPWVDMEDFISKINYVLERPDMIKEMGKAGRKWVVENASREVVIPQWKKVFDSLSVPLAELDVGNINLDWTDAINMVKNK